MVNRVGDNHQIFPEDAHRVAFADPGVNAYSVNSDPLDAQVARLGAFGMCDGIDPGQQRP
jgi:hypothetical protein